VTLKLSSWRAVPFESRVLATPTSALMFQAKRVRNCVPLSTWTLTDERIEPSPLPELPVLPDVLAVVLESCAPTGAAASTRPSTKSGVVKAAWRTRWRKGRLAIIGLPPNGR